MLEGAWHCTSNAFPSHVLVVHGEGKTSPAAPRSLCNISWCCVSAFIRRASDFNTCGPGAMGGMPSFGGPSFEGSVVIYNTPVGPSPGCDPFLASYAFVACGMTDGPGRLSLARILLHTFARTCMDMQLCSQANLRFPCSRFHF